MTGQVEYLTFALFTWAGLTLPWVGTACYLEQLYGLQLEQACHSMHVADSNTLMG